MNSPYSNLLLNSQVKNCNLTIGNNKTEPPKMLNVQGENNFLQYENNIAYVTNNSNTSASEADEEETDLHSIDSSFTNLGCETPRSIRKKDANEMLSASYQHEDKDMDDFSTKTNRLRIKKCQSMQMLNVDSRSEQAEDENFNFLDDHLSSTKNFQALKKTLKLKSSSNQSLAFTHPPQYELIGSKVVRGPDFKWDKQDGF
jgi:hypothetical protein